MYARISNRQGSNILLQYNRFSSVCNLFTDKLLLSENSSDFHFETSTTLFPIVRVRGPSLSVPFHLSTAVPVPRASAPIRCTETVHVRKSPTTKDAYVVRERERSVGGVREVCVCFGRRTVRQSTWLPVRSDEVFSSPINDDGAPRLSQIFSPRATANLPPTVAD